MDSAGIRAHSGCDGSSMEVWQAQSGRSRGRDPMMDYFTFAGFVAVALVAGLVGFRVAKDEISLRRKRVLVE